MQVISYKLCGHLQRKGIHTPHVTKAPTPKKKKEKEKRSKTQVCTDACTQHMGGPDACMLHACKQGHINTQEPLYHTTLMAQNTFNAFMHMKGLAVSSFKFFFLFFLLQYCFQVGSKEPSGASLELKPVFTEEAGAAVQVISYKLCGHLQRKGMHTPHVPTPEKKKKKIKEAKHRYARTHAH